MGQQITCSTLMFFFKFYAVGGRLQTAWHALFQAFAGVFM